MILNCLVVDDEPLAVELMSGYVERTPFLRLAGRCSNALEALQWLGTSGADVVFLDIQMPGLNGMELSEMLGERVKVIFTTAFGEYALQGYRVDALDYLLKPVSYSEFLRAANKALRWFTKAGDKQNTPEEKQRIFVKSGARLLQIGTDRICYIEGLKDYVKIYLEDQKLPVVSLTSMKALEEVLGGENFIRVHRSFIVNMDKAGAVEHNRIIFGDTYIPVSDSCKEKLAAFLGKRTVK